MGFIDFTTDIRFVLTCAAIQSSEKYSRTLLRNIKPAQNMLCVCVCVYNCVCMMCVGVSVRVRVGVSVYAYVRLFDAGVSSI